MQTEMVLEHLWKEQQKYLGKTCRYATLATRELTRTDLESNTDLRDDRPTSTHLTRGKILRWDLTYYIYIVSPYRAVNRLRLGYTNQSVNVV